MRRRSVNRVATIAARGRGDVRLELHEIIDRVLFHVLLASKSKCAKTIVQCHRKLGGLLPGNSKACAVVDDYLEHVIEHALSVLEEPDSENSRRKEQTFLCSLLAQGLSRKANILILPAKSSHTRLTIESQRVKDQIMAILVGGKVRINKLVLKKVLMLSIRILPSSPLAGPSMSSPALRK